MRGSEQREEPGSQGVNREKRRKSASGERLNLIKL
jgi:hypothetical protein